MSNPQLNVMPLLLCCENDFPLPWLAFVTTSCSTSIQ
jgi:hypothetical protein